MCEYQTRPALRKLLENFHRVKRRVSQNEEFKYIEASLRKLEATLTRTLPREILKYFRPVETNATAAADDDDPKLYVMRCLHCNRTYYRPMDHIQRYCTAVVPGVETAADVAAAASVEECDLFEVTEIPDKYQLFAKIYNETLEVEPTEDMALILIDFFRILFQVAEKATEEARPEVEGTLFRKKAAAAAAAAGPFGVFIYAL